MTNQVRFHHGTELRNSGRILAILVSSEGVVGERRILLRTASLFGNIQCERRSSEGLNLLLCENGGTKSNQEGAAQGYQTEVGRCVRQLN